MFAFVNTNVRDGAAYAGAGAGATVVTCLVRWCGESLFVLLVLLLVLVLLYDTMYTKASTGLLAVGRVLGTCAARICELVSYALTTLCCCCC